MNNSANESLNRSPCEHPESLRRVSLLRSVVVCTGCRRWITQADLVECKSEAELQWREPNGTPDVFIERVEERVARPGN